MEKNELLRLIPKVDDMINNEVLTEAADKAGRQIILDAVREVIDETRNRILDSQDVEPDDLNINSLLKKIVLRACSVNEMNLKKVINATGVILHTNLGRAPINRELRDKVWEIAENYSTLEYNVQTGERGSRYDHVQGLITKITGAEAAFTVNNNAAAVMLALNTLAAGKSVVVSRGELVEIGESFRIPEIMEKSGAKLVEVGSTNKTRLSDYEKAVADGETGALLKVHTSNYRIVGFTEETGLSELVELGKTRGIPVLHDIGSGLLIDLGKYGIPGEITVQDSIKAGADIVCFSGDKLLGGPQAGIIAGKKDLIDKMKKNPLTRAFRTDKLTLAALEATLRLYLDTDSAVSRIPALSMITMPKEVLRQRSDILYELLVENVKNCVIFAEDGCSQAGGGSLPLFELPARIVKVKPLKLSANELEERLRNNRVPVIARINRDNVCLDVRTIRDEDFHLVVAAFTEILN